MPDSTTYGSIAVQGLTLEKLARLIGAEALTITGTLTIAPGSAFSGALRLSGPANGGGRRDIKFQTNLVDRWIIRTDTGAESGGNAGSPFQLQARADDGSFLSTPIQINRATGYFETVLNLDVGGQALALRPASADHVYMAFYADTQNPTVRSGWIGFGSAATTSLDITNELGTVVRIPSDRLLVNTTTDEGTAATFNQHISLNHDVTSGNPYIFWRWKDAAAAARSGFLEAIGDVVRFYSSNLARSIQDWNFVTGLVRVWNPSGVTVAGSAPSETNADLFRVLREYDQATGHRVALLGYCEMTVANSGSGAQAIEGYATATHASGTVAALFGVIGHTELTTSATVTWGRGLTCSAGGNSGTGTVTNAAGLYVQNGFNIGGGAITTSYGVYIEGLTAGGTNIAIQTFAGNLAFFAAGSFGGGSKVMFIGEATTAPSSNPTGGGILYVANGALTYRGSAGTVTTIANA